MSQSIAKQALGTAVARRKQGHGMPAHAPKQPYSWERPNPKLPTVGTYSPVGGAFGARAHASRMTTAPSEYAAWQARLDASASAQAYTARRADVVACGSSLGPSLRCKKLEHSHECNAPLPPRAVPQVIYLEGLAPFLSPPRVALSG
jgi:hypothetical protein